MFSLLMIFVVNENLTRN